MTIAQLTREANAIGFAVEVRRDYIRFESPDYGVAHYYIDANDGGAEAVVDGDGVLSSLAAMKIQQEHPK